MNKGWFIPISFVCFAAVVVALWSYVTQTDGDPAAKTIAYNRAGQAGDFNRPIAIEVSALTPTDRLLAHRRALVRTLRQRLLVWRQSGVILADMLDQAAIRMRSNIGRTPVFQVLAGRVELADGEPEAALRRFDRLLNRHPGHVEALAGRAEAQVALKHYTDAVDTYERLILVSPENIKARYNYGVLLTRLAESGGAAEQFCEVVRLDPRHAKAYYNLAGLAQREGRLAEARDAWTAFTRLRPSVSTGWFNLGIVLMEFNEPLEATLAFQNVVLIDPDDALARLNLALAHESAGNVEEALDILNRAHEQSPCNPHIMTALADLHRDMAAWNPGEETTHLAAAVLLEDQIRMLEVETRRTIGILAGVGEPDEME